MKAFIVACLTIVPIAAIAAITAITAITATMDQGDPLGWGWSWFDAASPTRTSSTDWVYVDGYPVLGRR